MLLPENTIYGIVTMFFKIVAADYVAAIDKTQTMLYNIFNTDDNGDPIQTSNKDSYYKQAVEMFTRTDEAVNKVQITIGYNLQRANLTTIHVLLPTEGKGRIDSIGNNQGADPANVLDTVNNVVIVNKTRSKTAVYHLMVTSPNIYEVLLVYYFLHAMFLTFDDHCEFKGLRNLKMSGADLNFQSDLSMPAVHHRNITLEFDYEYSIKLLIPQQLISDFGFTVCADFALDNK